MGSGCCVWRLGCFEEGEAAGKMVLRVHRCGGSLQVWSLTEMLILRDVLLEDMYTQRVNQPISCEKKLPSEMVCGLT
jgi:hypothetical protein